MQNGSFQASCHFPRKSFSPKLLTASLLASPLPQTPFLGTIQLASFPFKKLGTSSGPQAQSKAGPVLFGTNESIHIWPTTVGILCTEVFQSKFGPRAKGGPWHPDARSVSQKKNQTCICSFPVPWPRSSGLGFSAPEKLGFQPPFQFPSFGTPLPRMEMSLEESVQQQSSSTHLCPMAAPE